MTDVDSVLCPCYGLDAMHLVKANASFVSSTGVLGSRFGPCPNLSRWSVLRATIPAYLDDFAGPDLRMAADPSRTGACRP